ncbi:MAG: hypothetical protein IPM24_12785 [Bryobacterales bacterium]|nr:hypothetical protein [Bryobacterales bacterium]
MRTLRCLTAVMWLASAWAQGPEPKSPAVYRGAAAAPGKQPAGVRWALRPAPQAALDRPASEDLAGLAEPSRVPRIGVHRDVPAGIEDLGEWEALPDGSRVWRVTVVSPGAAGLRVRFEDFDAGAGQVWVYGPGGEPSGPYSAQGPFEDRAFWSATVDGDRLTIEYEAAGEDGTIPFRLAKLSHRVSSGPGAVAFPIEDAGSRLALGPLADREEDSAAPCHQDVNCHGEWGEAARSVAFIQFEVDGFEATCSGVLLATRNNTFAPYFLTANHCIGTEEVARSVEVFWAYQSRSCNEGHPGSPGSVRSPSGATLLTTGDSTRGDFTLLRLQGVPAGVVFSGWDAGDPGVGSRLVGVHHPRGSYKRISFSTRLPDQPVTVIGLGETPADQYYTVGITEGLSEPGSSGSPAFSSPGVTVGVLSYGQTIFGADPKLICNVRPILAGYGRLSAAYPALKPYLEDEPATQVEPSPAALVFRGRNGVIEGGPQRISVSTASAGTTPVRFNARADAAWIGLSAETGQTRASAPGAIDISVDPAHLPQTQTAESRIAITSGSSLPRFVTVRIEMVYDRSDVQVAATPDPVVESNPGVWPFELGLRETAGAATTLDLFRINGVDYSARIEQTFGGRSLPASGEIRGRLQARGLRAPEDVYFEFGGIDPETGVRWHRTLAVRFVPGSF